jgi:UDP-3-O-[3-hydroxymyristoyl] glucosamine N-acyltransferase
MADSRFFHRAEPMRLDEIASITHTTLSDNADGANRLIHDVCALDRATEHDISFLDNVKYVETFALSKAGACFVRSRFASRAPAGMALLLTEDPYRCFALIAQHFYPAQPVTTGISPHAYIAATAKIGKNCSIDAGAVIGEHVEMGDQCHIGAGAVIQAGVTIGENTRIGANSTLSHCFIGAHVIIHRGVHIGQDGFGFALGREGHLKVPQLGRVMIEDNVEIGSGTCIDRGTGPDTFIGAGTKIDNLVQIGHNVHLGRQCIVVAQVGVSGSTRVGDGVMIGGQTGIAGHLKIGNGARIVAQSGVITDIPAGETHGGAPAVPVNDWHRQTIALQKLAAKKGGGNE